MTQSHIPDLQAIAKIDDAQVKFYAALGAAVSLSGRLELALLDIYAKATGASHTAAAPTFYRFRHGAQRRDASLNAMDAWLRGNPLAPEWAKLRKQITDITAAGSLRHLISHNEVQVIKLFGGFGGAPMSAMAFGEGERSEFLVTQDPYQVAAGLKPAQQANFNDVLALCRDLVDLMGRLVAFLERVP